MIWRVGSVTRYSLLLLLACAACFSFTVSATPYVAQLAPESGTQLTGPEHTVTLSYECGAPPGSGELKLYLTMHQRRSAESGNYWASYYSYELIWAGGDGAEGTWTCPRSMTTGWYRWKLRVDDGTDRCGTDWWTFRVDHEPYVEQLGPADRTRLVGPEHTVTLSYECGGPPGTGELKLYLTIHQRYSGEWRSYYYSNELIWSGQDGVEGTWTCPKRMTTGWYRWQLLVDDGIDRRRTDWWTFMVDHGPYVEQLGPDDQVLLTGPEHTVTLSYECGAPPGSGQMELRLVMEKRILGGNYTHFLSETLWSGYDGVTGSWTCPETMETQWYRWKLSVEDGIDKVATGWRYIHILHQPYVEQLGPEDGAELTGPDETVTLFYECGAPPGSGELELYVKMEKFSGSAWRSYANPLIWSGYDGVVGSWTCPWAMEAGRYRWGLFVEDGIDDDWSKWREFRLVEPTGLEARFEATPMTGSVGEPVEFRDLSLPPGDRPIEQWRWDFDGDFQYDVVSNTGGAQIWTYGVAGDYWPSLEVMSEGITHTTVVASPLEVRDAPQAPDAFTVEISASPRFGGDVEPFVGGHLVPGGTELLLRARGLCGYTFVGWSGDISERSPFTSVIVDRDLRITAEFAVDLTRFEATGVAVGSQQPAQPVASGAWITAASESSLSGASAVGSVWFGSPLSGAMIGGYVFALRPGGQAVYGHSVTDHQGHWGIDDLPSDEEILFVGFHPEIEYSGVMWVAAECLHPGHTDLGITFTDFPGGATSGDWVSNDTQLGVSPLALLGYAGWLATVMDSANEADLRYALHDYLTDYLDAIEPGRQCRLLW